MTIKKCDRCKAEIPEKDESVAARVRVEGGTYGTYDLCNGCRLDFYNWINPNQGVNKT